MAKQKENTEAPAAYDWDQYQGNTGLENLTNKDLGIPILQIVQKGSAEYDQDHEDYATKHIEGVAVGDIINSVTRQILYASGKEPVKVIPYFYSLVYVEWRSKANGGGIAATHVDESILRLTTRDDKNNDLLPNGNSIVTTAYMFVRILIDGQQPQDALIAMSSTQLKKARGWLNMMKNFRAPNGNTLPMFSRAYYLTTIPESNTKGTWRGWKIEAAPMPLADATLIADLVAAVQHASKNAGNLIGNSPQEPDKDIV
jgi:hypothetical protein